MLVITGEHLAGAHVSANTPGVRIARTLHGPAGRYEFAWLEMTTQHRRGKSV
jgi:hypothetical protein